MGKLGFKLWSNLDHNVIVSELCLLQDSVKTVISQKTSDKTFMDTIASIQSGNLEIHNIPSTWANLEKIDASTETRPADARILTALSLESHSDMWNWFKVQVTEPIHSLMTIPITSLLTIQPTGMPNPWILPLFQSVRLGLLANKEVSLQAKNFFPNINAPDYTHPPGRGALGPRILCHVENAVILWLQFRPRPGMSLTTSRAVATFVSIARQAFNNSNFLYLDYIQHAVKSLRSSLAGGKMPLTKIPWQELAKELIHHPLTLETSDASLALASLKKLLWAISTLPLPHSTDMSIHYKKAIETGGDVGVELFAPFIVEKCVFMLFIISLHLTSSPISSFQPRSAQTPLLFDPPPTFLSSSPMPQPLPIPPSIARFFSFLRAAFDVAEEGTVGQTLTQTTIIQDRDRYLPFRQLAPSKQIVLEDPEGPFSPGRLKTREGLFDALIFRLITQASPLLTNKKLVCFGSPTAFQDTTEGMDSRYFCNPHATGQHSRTRNIPYINTYWEHTEDWVAYINKTNITLENLLTWLTGHVVDGTRFFGMGNLVGWLLASDYAYAGLVATPDASEVGEIIFKIDAGGRDALELLGFDVRTKEACGQAMSYLWKTVETQFLPAEISKMGLEPITLEHALCKFKRLNQNYISMVCSSFYRTKLKLTFFLTPHSTKDNKLEDLY